MSAELQLRSVLFPFDSERRAWIVGSVFFSFLAILRGFAWPNPWAATQAHIDYSQGFTKHGLFGAALVGPLPLEHFARFALVSSLMLALLYGAIFVFAVWAGLGRRFNQPVLLALRSTGLAWSRTSLWISISCALSPLILNLLGWDVDRWYALCSLTSFLVVCVLCRYLPGSEVVLTPGTRRAAIAVIVLSMATGGPMISGAPPTPFPFFDPGMPIMTTPAP